MKIIAIISKSKAVMTVFIIFVLCATYALSWGITGEESWIVLGRWGALSKSHISINGDMEVLKDRILWQRHGTIRYQVVDEKEDALFVELDKEIDCGRYLRLGPESIGKLEVAFYKTKQALQAPKRPKFYKKAELEYEHGCSWGIYVRMQN